MPTYRYKVLKEGYIQRIYRVPGGQHDPIQSDKPLPKASWYEPLDELPDVKEEDPPQQEEVKTEEQRQSEVLNTLKELDPDEDTHWTKAGMPDLNTLKEKLGYSVKREELPERYTREESRRLKKIAADTGTENDHPNIKDIKALD